MSCNPQAIISALYEERENVRDIVFEEIELSDRMILRKIPDGGVVERHSNQDSVIYGNARQAPMAYRQTDHLPRDLESGNMTGADLDRRSNQYATNVNDVDDNACHGHCTIQFGQGYRTRSSTDHDLDVDTPVKCVREFDRHDIVPHVKGYFKGFRDSFVKYGLDNFSDNLINLAIQRGEANASVVAADRLDVATGGFHAPPQYMISIHFLEEYRDHIMAEMEFLNMRVPEDWALEVEMPRDDWFDAVKEHIKRRYSVTPAGDTPYCDFNVKPLEDPESPMRGRMFHQYNNIRCFFNERPIRGFFKPTGTSGGNTTYEFVRVMHWKNEIDEVGGLRVRPNHDYREDRIQVNGVWYDMVALIPHIHPESFTRFGLMKPFKPEGEANSGVNYDVKVIDGAYLDCNDHNDKFKLVARHEFRLKTMYPEVSGFIAYRYGRRPGYAISVTPRNQTSLLDNFSGPEEFESCDLIDPCTTAQCLECDEVPTSDGDCVDSGAVDEGVLGLEPCPVALTTYEGEATSVTITVRRTGELGGAATVDYDTANGSATAGVEYTDTNGSLSFAAGEEFKEVTIPIIGGSGDIDSDIDFTLTLSNASGATIGCAEVLITIEDLT